MSVSGIRELSKWLSEAIESKAREATLDTYAMMRKRVFEDGKASDGGNIGNISTKEGYFNPADFPKKFPPKGKTGKTKFKNGESHVTSYFPDGYKGAKSASGRDGKVDMYLTGDLRNNFLPYIEPGRLYAFVFTSDFANLKAKGNEERFSKMIFDPTQEEIDNSMKILSSSI